MNWTKLDIRSHIPHLIVILLVVVLICFAVSSLRRNLNDLRLVRIQLRSSKQALQEKEGILKGLQSLKAKEEETRGTFFVSLGKKPSKEEEKNEFVKNLTPFIEETGSKVLNLKSLSSSSIPDMENLRKIPWEISIESRYNALINLLRKLEESKYLLTASNLEIKNVPNNPLELEVSFFLNIYFWEEESLSSITPRLKSGACESS